MNRTGTAALLIAGTSIGGGMLALPVATAQAGFLPAISIYLACWLFMAATALLMAEVALHMDEEANLVSMARKTLGLPGAAAAWVLYLLLFYSLTVAYVTECGNLVADLLPGAWSSLGGSALFITLFGSLIFIGARVVGPVNSLLMVGLCASYLGFLLLGWGQVEEERLHGSSWTAALAALPISFTAFAFQGIIPTITRYLDQDRVAIRKAVLLGSAIPFVCYVIWQWLIQGIVSVEALQSALEKNQSAVVPLRLAVGHPWIPAVAEAFAFFALLTSFLGVTLGLRDFLADGFQVSIHSYHRFWICLLIFLPSLLISWSYPQIFLTALSIAGGLGCALLLGLLPILMAWRVRQQEHLPSLLPGGSPLLVLLLGFVALELVCQFIW